MTAFPCLRLAAIGVLALSFALAACGRKGALDPPPRSSAQPPVSGPAQQALPGEPTEDEAAIRSQPQGSRRKRFPLDVLLN